MEKSMHKGKDEAICKGACRQGDTGKEIWYFYKLHIEDQRAECGLKATGWPIFNSTYIKHLTVRGSGK